ncbi:MAG: NADPH-dependent FMN reductase [Acidobacteriota bacterium]
MKKIVAISGSLREQSSNAALLRAAAQVTPADVRVTAYERMGDLPHFSPDLDEEGQEPPPPVRELRELLIGAQAVLISSPEYAHGVPGSFKNLLDWLVSTGELVGKPVAIWNASPSGGHFAQAAILETLRTMNWNVVMEGSLVEPFIRRRIAGELTDEESLETLRGALAALVSAMG